jgi:hypothetical protein
VSEDGAAEGLEARVGAEGVSEKDRGMRFFLSRAAVSVASSERIVGSRFGLFLSNFCSLAWGFFWFCFSLPIFSAGVDGETYQAGNNHL